MGGNLGGLVLLLIILKRSISLRQIIDLHIDIEYTRKVLKYGIKAYLGNIVGFLNYRADTFILNYITDPSQVGIYSVSVNMAERLWIPSTAIGTVIFPRIASLENDEESRKQITPATARSVLWLSLAMAMLFLDSCRLGNLVAIYQRI